MKTPKLLADDRPPRIVGKHTPLNPGMGFDDDQRVIATTDFAYPDDPGERKANPIPHPALAMALLDAVLFGVTMRETIGENALITGYVIGAPHAPRNLEQLGAALGGVSKQRAHQRLTQYRRKIRAFAREMGLCS